MHRSVRRDLLLAGILCCLSHNAWGQQQPGNQGGTNQGGTNQGGTNQGGTLDDAPLEAGDEELATPGRQLVGWNEYEGERFTFRLGGGFLYEYAAYAQNEQSKEQFALFPSPKVRDARFVLKGRLKFDPAHELEFRNHVASAEDTKLFDTY